ncbi:MAG: C40 family peptidase [Rectinemataceae bacterium]
MRIAILAFALAAASLSAQTGIADLRAAIVNTALSLKGVPYVYGAESPPDAVDCSGFVQYVYKKAAGLEIPRNSRQQWEAGYPITMSEIRPGDVVVFDTSGSGPSHVALYIGDGSMIQAASEGPETGVIVSSTSDRYWAARLLGARSFLDVPGAAKTEGLSTTAGAAPTASSVPAPSTAHLAAPKPAASDTIPVSEIGFTLGPRPSVIADGVPTAAGSMLAFTITNGTGSNGSFQIDFYKDNLDFSRVVPLKHLTVSIEAKGHYRLAPFLFDQSGRYRLNVKTAGNTQLMQRSFEVVRIGKGGAIQAYTGRNAPQVTLPNGTAVTRIGLVVGSEAPSQGGTIRTARGSAILLRVANGTPVDRDFKFLLYKTAEGDGSVMVLTEDRARLPRGAWIELSPVLLSEAGVYRFVVKSPENDLLLQRTILVDQAP